MRRPWKPQTCECAQRVSRLACLISWCVTGRAVARDVRRAHAPAAVHQQLPESAAAGHPVWLGRTLCALATRGRVCAGALLLAAALLPVPGCCLAALAVLRCVYCVCLHLSGSAEIRTGSGERASCQAPSVQTQGSMCMPLAATCVSPGRPPQGRRARELDLWLPAAEPGRAGPARAGAGRADRGPGHPLRRGRGGAAGARRGSACMSLASHTQRINLRSPLHVRNRLLPAESCPRGFHTSAAADVGLRGACMCLCKPSTGFPSFLPGGARAAQA